MNLQAAWKASLSTIKHPVAARAAGVELCVECASVAERQGRHCRG